MSNTLSCGGSSSKVNYLVRQLKRNEIGYFDIPEEYRFNSYIVKIERKLGIRKSNRRGFDIIHNAFFVEERVTSVNYFGNECTQHICNFFKDFQSYYKFLEGDIYDKACYYQYNFSQKEIDTFDIKRKEINSSALINFTTKDFTIDLSEMDIEYYHLLEKDKILRKKWILKFNNCNTYDEFEKVLNNLKKSKFSDLDFFLYNFIFSDNKKSFDIIMQYLSRDLNPSKNILKTICYIYDSEKVLAAYPCDNKVNANTKGRKKQIQDYIKCLKNCEVGFFDHSYFDENTHFYCYQEIGFIDKKLRKTILEVNMYFETFQELADFLDEKLSNCDLSKAILPDVNFSSYEIDQSTKLPIQKYTNLTYSIFKGYDRNKEYFIVKQSWADIYGHNIKEFMHTFEYFFDFVYFLENDLSGADMLFCDGLKYINDLSNINLEEAKIKSNIMKKMGLKYETCTIDEKSFVHFPNIINNEKETANIFSLNRVTSNIEENLYNQKVYYITDLHLLHRIKNACCKSEIDIQYTIQLIVDNLLNEVWHFDKNIILIGGDTSSEFDIFKIFIKLLRQSIDEKNLKIHVIFLLGNHELWGFPRIPFDRIVHKYETVINEQRMYLLQNEIIFIDDDDNIQKITSDDILSESKEKIREPLKGARLIFFGGIAFSGYNKEFNANHGIYRAAINRNKEIVESKEFEKLYGVVSTILADRKIIICTHMPQKHWCSHNNQKPGFIYVSGHTHRNYFYDDGEIRIYADNQVGYTHENPSLKYLFVDGEYDWFSEYVDGIYEITKDQYINFYRGKNMRLQFARRINILYMLKKNGYYCFIHKSKGKQLSILNGGALKNLDISDINYYYDRMDLAISSIKKPLDKFTLLQNKIANEVKGIGGFGNIHGAIIDIDYNNHIYVNPYDLTIKGYWASDMIHKKVFWSIPQLLKANCPLLYSNYTKLLRGKSTSTLSIGVDEKKPATLPQDYLETDIYSASREISKMQKLSSNILSTWHESSKNLLE